MFKRSQRVIVPNTNGIQGIVQERREPQPALTLVSWTDDLGASHVAPFNDSDMMAANPPSPEAAKLLSELPSAVAAAVRVEPVPKFREMRGIFKRKPSPKTKSKSKRK